MQFKSKFEVEQQVFFLNHWGSVCSERIRVIISPKVEVFNSRDTHYPVHERTKISEIEYKFIDDLTSNEDLRHLFSEPLILPESRVFASKEELIKSL